MQSTEPSPGSSSTTQALPISTSRLPSSLPAQVLITKGHGLTFLKFLSIFGNTKLDFYYLFET